VALECLQGKTGAPRRFRVVIEIGQRRLLEQLQRSGRVFRRLSTSPLTGDNHLRHTRFVSLCDDKKPRDVRREQAPSDKRLARGI
jgi:hypothetical protein